MKTRPKAIFSLYFIFALLVSLLGSTVTYTTAQAAGILYAKPIATGNGNCLSWANACTLQTAIALSFLGDQIWVRAGAYKPTTDPTDRAAFFILKNGVATYGGFAGTETQLSQRNSDSATNGTVLSGDLNGDDNGFTNNGENSYNVVIGININSTAILDGFTIKGGNANDTSSGYGGGIYNFNSSPTLSNLTIKENSADFAGGGMANNNSSPMLTNVTLSGNTTLGDGGGMHNISSSPTLTNVTFSGNSASFDGGGMFNDGSFAKLTDATFLGNSSGSVGGGIYNSDSSILILTNVTFSDNTASNSGGGIQNSASASATLMNVTFSGNSASMGGGIYNVSDSSSTLINTLIANSSSGGDCINDAITPLDASSANNLIEDASNACGLTNGVNGNIVGSDPQLGPLANNGGLSQTHALLAGSPALDKGKDVNCPATDERGVPRPWGSHCDIGSYEFATRAIIGNAGTDNVILSYIDGASKTVTSQIDGSYSILVPAGWSGTVTPSHPCFTFSPANRQYDTILANQTAQDYTAAFKAASSCANINAKIGSPIVGTYGIAPQDSLRVSYVGINNGPVNVTSTNGKAIIVAERVLSKNGTQISHFSELMGLPQSLVSTTYAFPAYDNLFFDSQLRFGNVSNSTAHVHVYIGAREMTSGCFPSNSPYTLAPSASLRVSCPGVSGGPVKIVSDRNIVASLRVLYNNGSAVTSFSELMGLPASQWNTTYWMPWYNNVDLNTQFRIGNVGNTTTQVTVTVGGVIRSTFNLAPNTHSRFQIPGLNNGPVKITSSGGVPIVASQRVAHFNGTKWNDFSELMGLPASQLTTSYYFPWYNNVDLDTQLRFGNVSASTAHVRVFIGGAEMAGSPFILSPGASTRQSFAGINNGPVKIVSDVNIVASMRVLCNNGSAGLAFSELMGLPAGQLTTSYVLPWYNNIDLDTQLRIGVP